MHPRTIAILVGSILLLGLVMRVVVYETGLLPVSQELILKQATALTVGYTSAGALKTVTINRPAELADLFAVLQVRRPDERGDVIALGGPPGLGPGGAGATVTFHFPDGTARQLAFQGPGWLGPFHANPRFYQKLCDYVSRAEGRPVELLQDNPWMK
jgi:hypothetical protein